MEGRKLQLAGGSTYVISLPKRWVTHTGLKAGDTLFVDTETDGSISVRSKSPAKPGTRRKVFEEKGEEAREHLLRKLIAAYISGYGVIELHFAPDKGPYVRRVARDFCRLVVGPEVVEETQTALHIQDLSDPLELSTEKCLRRMHLVVRAMLEDAMVAIRTGRSALAQDVTQRDQDVDRLYWMVSKQQHLAHVLPGRTTDEDTAAAMNAHLLVAKLLERIGDHAERIASTFPILGDGKAIDAKLGKDLDEANTAAIAMLDRAFRSLVSGNIEEANDTIDARGHHQKMVDALSHRVATRKGEVLLALGTVVNSLGRTASYATDIAEQAINLSVFKDGRKS